MQWVLVGMNRIESKDQDGIDKNFNDYVHMVTMG